MKILFYGFQHAHMDGFYKLVHMTPEVEIAACIEEEEAYRIAAKERLGISFSEECYEEWLKQDVDVVAIGCQYGLRGQAVIKALKAGKHIVSDKPLCTSLEELKEIEQLALTNNCKISCMLDLRYLPSSGKAAEVLKSGQLGEIRNISFSGQHCIDYEHRPSWYFQEGMHGGTINDLAIHGVDLVRLLTGQEFVQVDGVRTWNSYAWKHPEFKDSAVFMARLSGGAEVLADVSYSAPTQVFTMPTYWNFKFWCEKGLLTFHLTKDQIEIYEEGRKDPIVLEGVEVQSNCLLDLMEEIQADTWELTKSVLESTRSALMIQKEADKQ